MKIHVINSTEMANRIIFPKNVMIFVIGDRPNKIPLHYHLPCVGSMKFPDRKTQEVLNTFRDIVFSMTKKINLNDPDDKPYETNWYLIGGPHTPWLDNEPSMMESCLDTELMDYGEHKFHHIILFHKTFKTIAEVVKNKIMDQNITTAMLIYYRHQYFHAQLVAFLNQTLSKQVPNDNDFDLYLVPIKKERRNLGE